MSRNVSVARKAKLSPKSKKFEKIRAKGNLEIFTDSSKLSFGLLKTTNCKMGSKMIYKYISILRTYRLKISKLTE